MKRGKKLTREQKILLDKKGEEPNNWLLGRETKTSYIFIEKQTNYPKIIEKKS